MGIIRQAVSVRPHDSLLYSIKVMIMEYVPKILVTDEKGTVLGILTQKDVLQYIWRSSQSRHLNSIAVSEVMKTDFLSVPQNIDALEAASLMVEKRQPLLVVTDDDGKMVGMIIKSDLARYYHMNIRGVHKVSEYMSSPVRVIKEEDTFLNAVEILVKEKIGRLIVINEHSAIRGSITTTDALYLTPAVRVKDAEIKVGDVMSPNVYVVDDGEDLSSASRMMADRKIKGLPVMNDSGALSGIVTTSDVVRALVDERTRNFLNELKLYTSTF